MSGDDRNIFKHSLRRKEGKKGEENMEVKEGAKEREIEGEGRDVEMEC